MSGTTTINLPDGTSQVVAGPDTAFGVLGQIANFSGPNGTGTETSGISTFTNGDAMTFLNYPDGNLGLAAMTYSGTGVAFNPTLANELSPAVGTQAFTVAATNTTISELVCSYADANSYALALTGGTIDYINGTSAIFQNTPHGPAQTDYSGPNGTGTVLGGVYFGTGTDLGTAFAIAASLPPNHG